MTEQEPVNGPDEIRDGPDGIDSGTGEVRLLVDATPEELVDAAAGGDEAAWGELVARYTPLVLSVIRAHGLTRADAADVNQTVWLRLVENLTALRSPTTLAAWLATTTRRECHRLVRLGRRTQPFDPLEEVGSANLLQSPEDPEPDEHVLRAERRQALRDGFAQLPARCRRLLALLTADPPATYREISEQLEMPVGSIGPTQARCVEKLRNSPAIVSFVGPPRATGGGKEDRRDVMAAGR